MNEDYKESGGRLGSWVVKVSDLELHYEVEWGH